jgi:micrococcal nuclease
MDRMTLVFWTVISFLLCTSAFYGFSAEQQRSSIQKAGGEIQSGDAIQLVKVIDGDSVLVAKEGEEPVTLRLVGIKSFDAKVQKDVMTPFAQASVELLKREMTGKSLRILLNANTPKDKYGRYLASLYAYDQDLAVSLINEGLVLVYPVYPFAAMPFYLQAQEQARSKRRGLWANSAASERAVAIMNEWRNTKE